MNGTPQGRQAPRDTLIAVNGYAVREIRKLVGIPTAQFAREANVDRSYLSRIENGQRTRVNPAVFAAMVRTLGVDRRALLAQPNESDEVAA